MPGAFTLHLIRNDGVRVSSNLLFLIQLFVFLQNNDSMRYGYTRDYKQDISDAGGFSG